MSGQDDHLMVILARHCLLTGCYFEPNNVNSAFVHDAQHGVQQIFTYLNYACTIKLLLKEAGVYL